jgi:hypothetical protein
MKENEGISEGIRLEKGYKLTVKNIDVAWIDKIHLFATDTTKPSIIIEEEYEVDG